MAHLERGPGIRKIGFLKKMKTMKKKLFVLHQDDLTRPARLEYYDNEKKFKSSSAAKRSIILKDCLSINPKSDAKHRHAIALYTKDDCFAIACENEDEQRDWLGAMEELQNQIHEPAADGESPRPNFEHIWPVQVKNKGLGGSSLQPGQYRLCLTNKSLSFIKLSNTEPDIVFQLASIRRCGHTDAFFYMELGRSSCMGAGELWMQVEDTVIAQNMHEAILSSMKTMNTAAEQPHYRPRSRSSADKTIKPSISRNSTLSTAGTTTTGTVIMDGTATLPARSNTMSAGQWDHPKSPLRRHQSSSKSSLHSTSLHRSATMSYKDSSAAPLSLPFAEYRHRTDSMGSRCSHRTDSSLSDDIDTSGHMDSISNSHSLETRDFLLDQACYMDMQANARDMSLSIDNCDGGGSYMDMKPSSVSSSIGTGGGGGAGNRQSLSTNEDSMGYMSMSPGVQQDDFCGSESPVVSMASSQDDDSYMDVSPMIGRLSTVQEKAVDGSSYMNMGGRKKQQAISMRLEKVQSFLSDDGTTNDFPKRANSCGSRQDAVQKPKSYAYLDMTGEKRSGNSSSSSSKSVSAPHLPPGVGAKQGLPKPRTDSGSSSTHDLAERFMVLDFTKDDFRNRASSSGSKQEMMRPRTSSGGAKDMMRPRTSSCGQEFRNRTSSFGSITRTQTLGRHDGIMSAAASAHRPRTATICAESMRPRTSSFGQSDMRPRSSSHGNARFRELRRKPNESSTAASNNSRHSSQESLKSRTRMSSRESINSSTSEYLDMNPRGSPSISSMQKENRKSRVGIADNEYVDMKPSSSSSSSAQDEYMTMEYQQNQKKSNERSSTTYPKSSLVTTKSKSAGSSSSSFQGKHTSSSESLSSGSEGRGRTRVMLNTSMEAADQGEYMDLDYQHSSPGGNLSIGGKMPLLTSSPAGSRSPKSKALENDDSSYVSYSPGGGSSQEHSPSLSRSGPYMEKVISPIREMTSASSLAPPFNPSHIGIFHGYKGKSANANQPGKHEYVNVQYKQTETVFEQMEYNQEEAQEPPVLQAPVTVRPALPEFRPSDNSGASNKAPKPDEDDYMDLNLGKKVNNTRASANDDYMECTFGKGATGGTSGASSSAAPPPVVDHSDYMEIKPQACSSSSQRNRIIGKSGDIPSVAANVDKEEDSYMLHCPAAKPSPAPSYSVAKPSPAPSYSVAKPSPAPSYPVAKPRSSYTKSAFSMTSSLLAHSAASAAKEAAQKLPATTTPVTATSPSTAAEQTSDYMEFNPGAKTKTSTSAAAGTTAATPPKLDQSHGVLHNKHMDQSQSLLQQQVLSHSSSSLAKSSSSTPTIGGSLGSLNSSTTKSSSQSNLSGTAASLSSNDGNSSESELQRKAESEESYMRLHYATLDLGDGAAASSVNSADTGKKANNIPELNPVTGLSYAEIDFKKSQDLLHIQEEPSAKPRETKAPFDL